MPGSVHDQLSAYCTRSCNHAASIIYHISGEHLLTISRGLTVGAESQMLIREHHSLKQAPERLSKTVETRNDPITGGVDGHRAECQHRHHECELAEYAVGQPRPGVGDGEERRRSPDDNEREEATQPQVGEPGDETQQVVGEGRQQKTDEQRGNATAVDERIPPSQRRLLDDPLCV